MITQTEIKRYNSQNNFETPLENHIAKIVARQFRHIEESLITQYELLDAQSSHAYCCGDHLRHKFISPLAQKMLELLESVTECAAEYDFVGLDEEA
jgi:UDP-N-acetylglucosamine pyrophosphorylase